MLIELGIIIGGTITVICIVILFYSVARLYIISNEEPLLIGE